MSRRGFPVSRRRVEVSNSPPYPNPCRGRKSRSCAILGRPFPESSSFRWGGRPFLGWSTSSGQLLDAIAAGHVGADSAASPASGRSEFPTGATESDPKHHQIPHQRGRFSGIRSSRWGVLSSFSGNPV